MEKKVCVSIKGIVQGVGFRPFCYRLAKSLDLKGEVSNFGDGVLLRLQGPSHLINLFFERLLKEKPPISEILDIHVEGGEFEKKKDFKITNSFSGPGKKTFIPPDCSLCDDCLKELLDPKERRYLYPFINCTNCGPRYTIIRSLPYDRVNTTMDQFVMCENCKSEYNEPMDRRFHAEPIACTFCGPRLWLLDGCGEKVNVTNPIEEASKLLGEGKVVAIKGLGGFHIACNAFDDSAVERLRRWKNRLSKPLAVMMKDIEIVRGFLSVSQEEERLLQSPQRPIVLLNKRKKSLELFKLISPKIAYVGAMLPYTPVHFLLMAYYDAPRCLVMTSGNPRGAPICITNEEAINKLRGIVDAFLIHNRPIRRRVDDSVAMIVGAKEKKIRLIRRARGYAPVPFVTKFSMPAILAFGADLKNTISIGCGNEIFLSQHIGNLDDISSQENMQNTIDDLTDLLGVKPELVAVDMHPDYYSTRIGQEYARKKGLPIIYSVQHHHAHMLSVIAEYKLKGDVLGCILDGTGYGLDGTIWGGEIFLGKCSSAKFKRLAHLESIKLPGGDKAAKEPWRIALSLLYTVAKEKVFELLPLLPTPMSKVSRERVEVLMNMMERGFNSPLCSSAGRLFDAVSALLGLKLYSDYEGQAAMELEALATYVKTAENYPISFFDKLGMTFSPMEISIRPLVEGILEDIFNGVEKERIARKFHNWLSSSFFICLREFSRIHRVNQVVLSGGVMQNRIFVQTLIQELEEIGLKVFIGEKVPVNDGGISLGQTLGGYLKHVSCCSHESH